MPRKSVFAAFAAAFALTAAVAASPTLAQQFRPAQSVAALQAAAPALGMAIMSAYVDQSGEQPAGAGVIGVRRIADGLHFVAFNRSVEGCVYVGTTSIAPASPDPGLISTNGVTGMLNGVIYYGVQVDTDLRNGDPSDLPFYLLVFCAQ